MQVVEGGQVTHRVVDEDRVEQPAQAQRAHVALDVLAVRVDAPALLEHAVRQVGQRDVLNLSLVVPGVIAAAGAKLEQRARRRVARLDDRLEVERRLLAVLLGRRKQVEPVGEVGVGPRQLIHYAPAQGNAGQATRRRPDARRAMRASRRRGRGLNSAA